MAQASPDASQLGPGEEEPDGYDPIDGSGTFVRSGLHGAGP